MASAVTIALPSIGAEFKMDAVLLSWVVSSYIITGASLLVPFGKAADIYGKKRIYQYGIAIFTVSMFLLPFAASGPMLIVLRVLQGFGSAMTYSTGFAILTSVFPSQTAC